MEDFRERAKSAPPLEDAATAQLPSQDAKVVVAAQPHQPSRQTTTKRTGPAAIIGLILVSMFVYFVAATYISASWNPAGKAITATEDASQAYVSNGSPPSSRSAYDYIGTIARAKADTYITQRALLWGTEGDAAAFLRAMAANDAQGASIPLMLTVDVPVGTRLHILDVVPVAVGDYDYYLYKVRREYGSPSETSMIYWTNRIYLELPALP